jgi:hypothetical protein
MGRRKGRRVMEVLFSRRHGRCFVVVVLSFSLSRARSLVAAAAGSRRRARRRSVLLSSFVVKPVVGAVEGWVGSRLRVECQKPLAVALV